MKDFLSTAWRDIQQRKNLELYLVLIVIVAIFLADVFGLETESSAIEIVLAALAVLVYGMIDSRHLNERIETDLDNIEGTLSTLSTPKEQKFIHTFPDNLEKEFTESKEVWIIAISFYNSMKNYYSIIETKLRNGHKVNILLLNPECEAVDFASSRAYNPVSPGQLRFEISKTLEDFCALKKHAGNAVEIRTTGHPISYGMFAVNPSTDEGKLFISLYSYKIKQPYPSFILAKADLIWYETFLNEFHLLWQDATEWTCF